MQCHVSGVAYGDVVGDCSANGNTLRSRLVDRQARTGVNADRVVVINWIGLVRIGNGRIDNWAGEVAFADWAIRWT